MVELIKTPSSLQANDAALVNRAGVPQMVVLGSAAVASTSTFATAAQGAKADTAVQPAGLTKAAVGLDSVDNTADAAKSVASAAVLTTARTLALAGDVTGSASFNGSANVTITAAVADDSHNHIIGNVTGLQAALDAKAALASPALTGVPTAPTATPGTNTTQIATTAFVAAAAAAAGAGDMLKSVYDTNDDGKVGAAVNADAVPWTGVSGKPTTFAPSAHTHAASEISDASAAGRTLLTAADAPAQRTALGLGTAATTAATAYATAAQGVDAREWTATTVAQVEAEAGAATTRRAWTAERVRQAIAAWWATITLTKSDVGLANVDNTADASKNVASAATLTTARTITLAGDATGSVSFDGSANVSITATVVDDSHNHVIANVDGLQTALDGKVGSATIATMTTITQAAYDGLGTPDAATYYIIIG